MTEEIKKDIDQEQPNAAAEVIVFDHIKIIDNETGKEIVNKRG